MRKGSALLVVLGMISFMLFSGLAFSVYMRQTRVPSSFLRRTTSTRQLTKAALAEAMYDIDRAIGNDPHPGVYRSSNGNFWNHRVFVGERRYSDIDSKDNHGYTGDTISTLTLEGLAYVPPSLINEARYYSRHTPSASWHKFRFEAGRYAYTAIDVSDYFDVNRILADRPRSSAASRRLTLAHIFEKSGGSGLHGAQQAGEAEAWDKWLEDEANVRTVDDTTDEITFSGRIPMVSMADFNLLMGTESFGLVKSPFVDYINDSGSAFYPDAGDSAEDEQAEAFRSMTFVTDSKFVEESSTADDDNILDANQPFDPEEMAAGATKNLQMYLTSDYPVWKKFLSRLGMCMLCDYLDEDSVPLSLAIPTCEKIPMICSIHPQVADLTLKLAVSGDPTDEKQLLGEKGGKLNTDPKATSRKVSCYFTYEIDPAGFKSQAAIEALAVYPYIHNFEEASYTVDGQVALFFTVSGKDIPLVLEGNYDPAGLVMDSEPATGFSETGVLKFRVGQSDFTVTGNGSADDSDVKYVKKDKDLYIQDFASTASYLPMNKDATNLKLSKSCILGTLVQWTQTRTVDPDTGEASDWEPTTPQGNSVEIVSAESGFGILDENGSAITDIKQLVTEKANLELNLAVWLRIKESSGQGKVVDVVPAWMNDDINAGFGASGGRSTEVYKRYGINTQRILRFKFKANGDAKVLPMWPMDMNKMGERKLTLDAPTIVCPDPRFNHNPYNWLSTSSTDVQTAWEENVNCSGDGRNGDYFLAISNQGYLQSVYELAMLIRTTDPSDGVLNADERFGNLKLQSDYGYPVDFPSTFANCIDANNMWKSYRPTPVDGAVDDFSQLGLVQSAKGLRVNPYSDSTEVLAAAFANTPCDWAHASTNRTANKTCELGADDFNQKYAWNAYGDEHTRLPWDAVLDLAEDFKAEVRSQNQAWNLSFRNLWSGDGNQTRVLAGIDFEKLSHKPSDSTKIRSVDRKFLYGFWHDCFAANQQLFLVFVRSEPMMMGGGVAGNAPPQLSSRAVALVWRDPNERESAGGGSANSDSDAYIPHAMRILFYHPLD